VENYPGIQPAIATCEKEMPARAFATATGTRESTDVLHSPNAVDFLINLVS
jgi:hypothetical protein